MSREMRRKDRAMGRDDSEKLLETALVGRLGVFDEEPYIVPVNYVYQSGKLWFHCAPEGRKLRAIERNPRVCFEVDEFLGIKKGKEACSFGAYFKSVIAFGEAQIIKDVSRKRDVLTMLLTKYGGDEDWSICDRELEKVAVVEVTLTFVAGKCRLP